jgi:hypothetical protein
MPVIVHQRDHRHLLTHSQLPPSALIVEIV